MRKALYILGDLDERDIGWLAGKGEQRSLAPDEPLVHAGVAVEALYIVLDGELAVVTTDGGRVARLVFGDIIGEMSLVEKRPPNVSVMALTSARILAVPQDDIRVRLNSDEGFAARFYRALAVFLSDRLRSTVSTLGYGAVSEDAATAFEADHELDETVLDSVHVAGDRLRRLLARLESGSTS